MNLNLNYVEFTTNYENHVNFKFSDPPLQLNLEPQSKFFTPHCAKLFFGKILQRTIMYMYLQN